MTTISTVEFIEVVKVLSQIQQESNLIKDYVFPILTILVSALLSGYLANVISKRSQDRAEERKTKQIKIDAINNYVIQAEFATQNLINIKSYYSGKLTQDSLNRMLSLPPILKDYSFGNLKDISSLIFVSPTNEQDLSRWNQLTYINMIFDNYRDQLSLLKRHSNLKTQYMEKANNSLKSKQEIIDDHVSILGLDKTCLLIQLTEFIIISVDDLLLYFKDFTNEFPKVAKAKLGGDIPSDTLIDFSSNSISNNESRKKFFERSPKVNPQLFSDISGLTEKEVEELFRYNYTNKLQ